MAANDAVYCQKSSATETDWEKIYEVAFRPDQRTPLIQLQDGVRSGQMYLHRTSASEGLLCFSITNILPSVALLAYLATDPNKRSSGIGSKHMKSLIAQIRAEQPHLLGMFAEIESTREKGISEEEKKHRRRRLQFYQRLGFKRYKSAYTIPSYEPNIADEEGELLWLEFTPGAIGCDKLATVIKEIYTKAYLLKEDDVRVTNVPVLTGDATCDLVEETQTETATSAPAAATKPPENATSAPTAATKPPENATSAPTAATKLPENATSAPTAATKPPENATSAPTAATKPPENGC